MLLMKQNMFLGVSRVVSEKALTAIRHREFLISAGGGGGGGGERVFVHIRASPQLKIRSTPSP